MAEWDNSWSDGGDGYYADDGFGNVTYVPYTDYSQNNGGYTNGGYGYDYGGTDGSGSGSIDWSGLGKTIGGYLNSGTGGALIGGAIGGSSLGQGKQAGVTTTTQVPWEQMQPYLTGMATDAQTLYQQNQGTPSYMTDLANMATENALNYQNFANQGMNTAYDVSSGAYDPVLNQVNPTDVRSGFSSLGNLDPSGAYAQMLSGQVSPYLNEQAKAITDQANQNLSLNVMPSIRGGAQSAGQYGSSRQGIAEGVAAGLSNQGLSSALSGLYGNAWNNAQNQMASAANTLGNYGVSNNQFNANLGMNQNAQNMQAANQALNARQTGQNMGASAYQTGNAAVQDAYNTQNTIAQYPWQNLKNYQSVINPMAGMGSSSSTPYYTNTANNILGGAMAGYGLLGGNKNNTGNQS